MPAESTTPPATPLAVDSHGAACLLGISESHFRNMVAAGRCPAGFTLGRRRLWSTDDLRKWIANGCPTADKWAAAKR